MNQKDNGYERELYWSGHLQDDVDELGQVISLSALNYQDIIQHQRLAAIHDRWPLLRELGAAGEDDSCR
ncbi:cellulose biosynthesis protein BcsR [Zobellella sp. DQSA1]|uniref:cellulose biosynthesis protein BcsR n=1 Tax=Zobellella sp. DQSA1 TaxID=3342386 RepID=UPI0035C202E1